MEFFTPSRFSKSQIIPTGLARTLNKQQKLAVSVAMHLVVNRYGQRRVYPQETAYMLTIQKRVLNLADTELAAFRTLDFNPFSLLNAMPEGHKRYFGAVFYQLAALVADPAVLGRASVVLKEMGLSLTNVAHQPAS